MIALLAIFLVALSTVSSLEPCDHVGQLKPDPKYCNYFYQCTNDGWTSLQCQPPTVFNPKILVCDWPENVDCPENNLHSLKKGLEPCDHVGQLKPDPKYCNYFYQCTNDGWTSLQCQPPTVFNPKILVCDWPENVDCPENNLHSLKKGLEPCDHVGQMKPDPKYCNYFYQCTNTGWASLQCQPPTLFNPEINVCDWPENVDCPEVSLLKKGLEPCDHVGQLKPDPKYCNYFYQCTNDGWTSLQCQPPTVFNPKILVCDWPENVDCPEDK